MSRLAGQRRALDQIEKALAAGDRPLWTMYAIFTVLTRHDDMPVTERAAVPRWRLRLRLRPPPRPRLRPRPRPRARLPLWLTLVTAMGLATVIGFLTLILLLPAQQECPISAGAATAGAQALRARRPASCPARQTARTGPQVERGLPKEAGPR
jgi:hypothetical protein